MGVGREGGGTIPFAGTDGGGTVGVGIVGG